MDPQDARSSRVEIAADSDGAASRSTEDLVEQLMGRRPELRLAFIQENARQVEELDV